MNEEGHGWSKVAFFFLGSGLTFLLLYVQGLAFEALGHGVFALSHPALLYGALPLFLLSWLAFLEAKKPEYLIMGWVWACWDCEKPLTVDEAEVFGEEGCPYCGWKESVMVLEEWPS